MKIKRKTIFRLLLILPLLWGTISLSAQSDPTGKSAATRTYAITNASIIQSPGNMIEGGTIVIKNGLINAVGKNVSVPDDAEVLDGTGLFVYPGFIDGMSYTAAKRPKAMERPNNLFTPDPPNDYAGITPENHVVSQIDIGSGSIESMRKAGFTISHTVPYGRMLPGSGALVMLTDKSHADEMILAEDVAMYSQFVGAPGAYPGNILGIMAKWRNLYRNAAQDKQHTEMYTEDPSGIERPSRDRVTEAFFPVVSREKPVFFNVTSMLNARRAMRLQKDLGFNLVLGNVQQAWDLIDEIKASGAQLFMSMDLPKEPKDSKDEDKSDEVKQLEERRMEFYNKYLTQYASLQSAGIPFGFSSMGTSASKVKTNLMAIIEKGLSEDAALAALTTNPASMLGISKMAGTVEAGKLGNIVVTTAPYFTKKSQVKHVFVDGDKFDYEVKEDKKGSSDKEATTEDAPAASSDVLVGTWSYSLNTPGGEQGGKMIIRMENGAYAGTLTSDDGSPDNDMRNISFREGTLAFDFGIDAGGQSVDVVVTGTVDGKSYEATATASVGGQSFEMEWSASKDDR